MGYDSDSGETRASANVAQAVVIDPPRSPRRGSRWIGRLLLALMVVGVVGSLMIVLPLLVLGNFSGAEDDRLEEKHVSHQRGAENKIAIISVEGVILDGEGVVKRQIQRVIDDKTVRAVVLRVDSPGGSVTASDYLFHHLSKLAKAEDREIPIVVSMGGMAASGGYYVSMAVGDTPDVIFAEPATWTGSIGVVIPHYDVSGLLEQWDVEEDSVTSHRLKGMGSMTREMTPEERAIFQDLVDQSFKGFQEVVAAGRPQLEKEFRASFQRKLQEDPKDLARTFLPGVDRDELDEKQLRDQLQALLDSPKPLTETLFTGRVFTAQTAQEFGLVDRIGFIEDAVSRAIVLTGLEESEVEVVKYKQQLGLAGILFGSQSPNQPFGVAQLLDASAPRAYYLWTSLPPLFRANDR